ncbi:MAG TPA: PDZ domain-containing protein [Pyrinomonadaceae bacterium]|nr:PDZ domain-containing protein [Pyrinomonadaceae bacterium]
MGTIKKTRSVKLIFATVVAATLTGVVAVSQTPAPTPKKVVVPVPTVSTSANVIVEAKSPAPQVVTILHRLSGLKLISLLMSKQDFEMIQHLDPNFQLAGEVHTNVIAGVALDDGRIIAAWLPEAEAEMPWTSFPVRNPRMPRAATAPPPPPEGAAPQVPAVPVLPEMPSMNFPPNMLQPADLKVITSDGRRIVGRYIGLDGLTGLSLIALENGNVTQEDNVKELNIVVGQRLRVIGPQRVHNVETNGSSVYIRIGETDAVVVDIIRAPSGGLARVRIRGTKFSPANIGAVAINEKNETLGIVDAVEGGEATIVPLSLVRMAAKRVVARQASVPRPWLGIRGEPVNAISLDKIMKTGWELEKARALAEKQQGIMLTSVMPGSPAALAKLKVGDVILRVNDGFIRNAQELSFQLDEVTPENPVRFTVARPDKQAAEAMEIKLSESPDPLFGRRMQIRTPRPVKPFSLRAQGIEAVALRPSVAMRFGSTNGGLLVVAVEPSTDAFTAGLRPGDLIEMIDGQPVYSGDRITVSTSPGKTTTCTILRNKEKITVSFKYSFETDERMENRIERRIEEKVKKKERDEDQP